MTEKINLTRIDASSVDRLGDCDQTRSMDTFSQNSQGFGTMQACCESAPVSMSSPRRPTCGWLFVFREKTNIRIRQKNISE